MYSWNCLLNLPALNFYIHMQYIHGSKFFSVTWHDVWKLSKIHLLVALLLLLIIIVGISDESNSSNMAFDVKITKSMVSNRLNCQWVTMSDNEWQWMHALSFRPIRTGVGGKIIFQLLSIGKQRAHHIRMGFSLCTNTADALMWGGCRHNLW